MFFVGVENVHDKSGFGMYSAFGKAATIFENTGTLKKQVMGKKKFRPSRSVFPRQLAQRKNKKVKLEFLPKGISMGM